MFDAHAHIGIATDNALVNTTSGEEARNAKGFKYLAAGLLYPNSDLELYEELLKRGLYSGEIGIDKRFPEKDKQIKVFKEALSIAKSYDRLITIHAVGYIDELLKCIDEIKPKKFIVHGFTGSFETAQEITKRGGFISLSPRALKAKSFKELLTLPFLVESDMITGKEEMEALSNLIKTINQHVPYNTEERTEKMIRELLDV